MKQAKGVVFTHVKFTILIVLALTLAVLFVTADVPVVIGLGFLFFIVVETNRRRPVYVFFKRNTESHFRISSRGPPSNRF